MHRSLEDSAVHDHPPRDQFISYIRSIMKDGHPVSSTDRNCGFYILTHRHSDRFYVGSTEDVYDRIRQHRDSLIRRDFSNLEILNLCERERGFFFDVSFVLTKDREQAYDYEQLFLNCFMSTGRLLNTSIYARPYGLGRPHTEEHIQNLRTRMLGNQHGAGHVHTEEHKAKISAALKGIPKSAETVQRMKAAQKTKGVTIKGITYSGIQEAARQIGISAALVHRRVHSTNPHYKDWQLNP